MCFITCRNLTIFISYFAPILLYYNTKINSFVWFGSNTYFKLFEKYSINKDSLSEYLTSIYRAIFKEGKIFSKALLQIISSILQRTALMY